MTLKILFNFNVRNKICPTQKYIHHKSPSITLKPPIQICKVKLDSIVALKMPDHPMVTKGGGEGGDKISPARLIGEHCLHGL